MKIHKFENIKKRIRKHFSIKKDYFLFFDWLNKESPICCCFTSLGQQATSVKGLCIAVQCRLPFGTAHLQRRGAHRHLRLA